MPIIISDIEQGHPEWHALCCGNPGASNISKIITNKGDPSKQAGDYMRELAGEIITGKKEETFQSIHMQNGLEREDAAIALFEMIHNVDVKRVALVYKDELKKFHVSPDGLIGDNAGLEVKNPMMKTHVKYLLDGKLPSKYFSQIQMSLYVCEREYWWFMSNYVGLPPLILKVNRNEAFILKLEAELENFVTELAVTVSEIRRMW